MADRRAEGAADATRPPAATRTPAKDGSYAFRSRTGSRSPRASSRRARSPTSGFPLLCLPACRATRATSSPLGAYFAAHPTGPRSVLARSTIADAASPTAIRTGGTTRRWSRRDDVLVGDDGARHRASRSSSARRAAASSRCCSAALRPALIAGVVLNDIGPVLEGTGLARIKAYLSSRRVGPEPQTMPPHCCERHPAPSSRGFR